MNRLTAQVAIAAVALVLGFLVVLQIRAQGSGNELAARSAQELTLLVANLNDRNDQLRTEVASLEGEMRDLETAKARGESSLGELGRDLRRLRAWAGLDAVTGPGIRVTINGGSTAKAPWTCSMSCATPCEAMAIDGVRVVPGRWWQVPRAASRSSRRRWRPGHDRRDRLAGHPDGLADPGGGIVALLGATIRTP